MDLYTLAGLIVLSIVAFALFKYWSEGRKDAAMEAAYLRAREQSGRRRLNFELTNGVLGATTAHELNSLEVRVRSQKEMMFDNDFVNLLQRIDIRRRKIEEGEAAKAEKQAELAQKFAKLRILQDIDDPKALFEELHRLLVTNEDAISYRDFKDFGVWETAGHALTEIYDNLLDERLRELLAVAKSGSPEASGAYEELTRLRHEITESWGEGELELAVEDEVLELWREVTVLFSRSPDWDDFVDGDGVWETLSAERLDEIARKAEEGDLLSMQYARLLLLEVDDDFNQTVINIFLERLSAALNTRYEAMGFAGEGRRSVVEGN